MNQQTVVIKSNKYGITLFLDKELPFKELLTEVGEKFKASSKFFHNAQMALAFEGRTLSKEEQIEIIRVIQENSTLEILCIIEKDILTESYMKQVVEERQQVRDSSNGKFYKGTLRSGQVLESETSIIILGDVNPGAKVVSKGNVVVLGTLKGMVHAGAAGNENAFVAALNMRAMQIRINDTIARSADEPVNPRAGKKASTAKPMIAYTEDGNIYMEPITKEVINDIRM
ncbi:MAG: septum site-determining protein MinC [Lachnospiraceae bacterium]|nr:septum site-determining protein MinC [Lachnospiraceae bacterium]